MLGKLLWLNPVLMRFGYKIIESRLGRWYIGADGKLARYTIPMGWRIAPRLQWQDLGDDTSEMDRFISAYR